MQNDAILTAQVQPLLKLVQSNMALFMKFSTSREFVAEWMAGAQAFMQRAPNSALNMATSPAFAELLQGMMKNYAEFMTELTQSGMTVLTQAPTVTLASNEEDGDSVTDLAAGRKRRRA
jgi:selenocysteine lyase/cysteine desulfurase